MNTHVSLVHYVDTEVKTSKIYMTKNVDNVISFTHIFSNREIDDTHLKINGDIVATYMIKVNCKNPTLI
ncbi:hypothetical protein ACWGOQ_0020555 [Aquimarina sp. M1]